jgi:hypothetical protein
MLSFASDFWPLFWAIIACGAALTVGLSIVAATFRPSWLRPSRLRPAGPRRHQLAIVHHLLATGSRQAHRAA